jgi:hypothetical protein
LVSKELLEELKSILESDYGVKLDSIALAKLADDLVGYFSLLVKINNEFGLSEDEYNKQKFLLKQ